MSDAPTSVRRRRFHRGLLLTVVVAANLSNVLNPRRGLAGAIRTLATSKPAASGELTPLTAWVRSGSAGCRS